MSRMSYTITLRIYQSNRKNFFRIVEKTAFGEGVWDESFGQQVLTSSSSGNSGIIMFQDDNGERFTLVLGVHNYAPWTDTVTGVSPRDTAGVVIAQYYNNGPRAWAREKTWISHTATSSTGTRCSVNFTNTEGHDLKAQLYIE
ncbi:lectin [Trametopsis cervina]|nr:lectin [Trametopsis cervina]